MTNQERQKAIEFLEEAKKIHKDYLDILEIDPMRIDIKKQGGSGWHKMWIERYDLVLKILRES